MSRTTGVLRRLPLFADLPEEDLRRLCRLARRETVPAGTLVMEEGTPGDGLYVVTSGELEVTTRQAGPGGHAGPGDELVLARRGPGDVLGEMSLLEQAPRSASVRAVTDAEIVVLQPAAFQRLLADRPVTAGLVLRTMAARLRSTEASLMAREKLASLGTLAAGLAHELNNPAAAIRRATDQLATAVDAWKRWSTELGLLTLDPAQAGRLQALQDDAAGCATAPPSDPLAAAEAEEQVAEWLEDRDVAEPWERASTLVAYGWSVPRLEPLADTFAPAQLRVILAWLGTALAVRELLAEIDASATAISDIVRATRSYAYLDRAPVQDVDLQGTLETTLTILRHELKQGISVVRDFDPDLPRIEAFGSELTQVWTNLIDNAIDAMDGHGTLTIRTRRVPGDPAGPGDDGDRGHVQVEIADAGPGIPADARARIFEPFFTTKPPGEGSGLGLHIAHDIIVNRHHGRIDVDSGDDGTTFRVLLPRRLQR